MARVTAWDPGWPQGSPTAQGWTPSKLLTPRLARTSRRENLMDGIFKPSPYISAKIDLRETFPFFRCLVMKIVLI